MNDDFKTYQSPFSWRYGSRAMRHIWSEINKRKIWRQLWLSLAEVEAFYHLVKTEELIDLRQHVDDIDIIRSLEFEQSVQHDLMAELKVYAEQCKVGGGIIHLGATSMDIKDNADVLIIRQAIDLILSKLSEALILICKKVIEFAEMPILAFTHLQPAEPSTLGYRLVLYAQDLFFDWNDLKRIRSELKGKGFKGAVGTSASFADLIGEENLRKFEEQISDRLDLSFYPVASQTYPRKQDFILASNLAGLGASLYKFAFDVRLLQSPMWGEIAEPFNQEQVGSSAMPFKRNPINSEKINSLARLLAQFPRIAWDNEAHSLLERTLDDSANRRSQLPEMFLICDELVITFKKIVQGLRINNVSIRNNLDRFGIFAATERVLTAACKAGANRQLMHEKLRQYSLQAWQTIESDHKNSLRELLLMDQELLKLLGKEKIFEITNVETYLGDAPIRARELAKSIIASLA